MIDFIGCRPTAARLPGLAERLCKAPAQPFGRPCCCGAQGGGWPQCSRDWFRVAGEIFMHPRPPGRHIGIDS